MKAIRIVLILLLWVELSHQTHRIENHLAGKHIVVITENFPPVCTLIRNSSGHIVGTSGSLPDQIHWISRKLKFDYQLTTQPKIIPGPNGTKDVFSEMYRQVSEGEADLATGPFATTRDQIHLCGIIGGSASLMLVEYPQSTKKSIYATVEPFNYEIWIGIFISLGVVTLSSFLVFYARSRYMKSDELKASKVYNMFIYLFKMIIAQGCQYKRSTYAIGVLAFTWSIVAFVIVNAYNSSVISYLSINYKKPEVSTFKELANNDNFNVLTLKGTVLEIDIKTGVSTEMKAVAEKMRQCSDCAMNSFDLIVRRLMQGQSYVAVLPDIIAISLMDKHSTRGVCKLTIGKEKLKWHHMFYGVSKTSPYKEEINRESLWYMAHGMWHYWQRTRAYSGNGQCLLNYNSKGVQAESVISPIKLKQLFVPFVFLLCGYILALFQFVREKMHEHLRLLLEEKENSNAHMLNRNANNVKAAQEQAAKVNDVIAIQDIEDGEIIEIV